MLKRTPSVAHYALPNERWEGFVPAEMRHVFERRSMLLSPCGRRPRSHASTVPEVGAISSGKG